MRAPPDDARRGPHDEGASPTQVAPTRLSTRENTHPGQPVQRTLWEPVELHRVGYAGPEPPRARSRDRATSAAAAASLDPPRLGLQCRAVLDVLRRAACQGATRDEIAAALDWRGDRSVLSRRITDLTQAGLVLDVGRTRPGVSGRQLTVWGARGACGGQPA
jgi:hypothetical protein